MWTLYSGFLVGSLGTLSTTCLDLPYTANKYNLQVALFSNLDHLFLIKRY